VSGSPSWSPEGIYLALETSGAIGSVALARGRRVIARGFLPRSQEQARRILPAVDQVLGESGLAPSSLSGVVVGAGPGSFTGLRIAAATGKGLAHGLGIPLWSLSSLAAAALSDRVLPRDVNLDGWWENGAHGDRASGRHRYVLFDARGERVYAACHELGSAGVLATLVAPHATSITRILAAPAPDGATFCGDGALRHADRIRAAGYPVLGPPAGVATADALLHLLASGDPAALADARTWEPDYLKASSAEREAGPL
jgi:tRNA threonylcarbamoyladenosine biosynthesis protein TsaB